MKYLSRLLFLAGVAFGLTACNDTSDIIVPDGLEVDDMPVNITFSFVDKDMQTRSMVSGTEDKVHTMQLVCFDANGQYLGIRNADVTSDAQNVTAPYFDTGVIKGTVPQGTSRIHFIANRNLTIPLSFSNGTAEETVMKSIESSTLYTDKPIGNGENAHQEICYWGYHKEGNATAMNSWLQPAQGTHNTVYMIRDRARVVLSYDPTGADPVVNKIEWLVHNGRARGYLAPKSTDWWDDVNNTGKYYGYSTVENHTTELISTAGVNEYDGDRYSLWRSATDNEDANFDVAYQRTGTYTPQPQFVFDDRNLEGDGVKIILKVTYANLTNPVYHVLRFVDDDKHFYPIVRNNTYYIDCKKLNPDIAGYPTLKDAIEGNEFVNADMEVDWSIPDINDEDYALQIKLPNEGTSVVFNQAGDQTMDFAFINASDLSWVDDAEADDFEISWYGYDDDEIPDFVTEGTEPELDLVTLGSVKRWRITINLKEPTSQLQEAWIKVKHTESGLTRYIHVYVIDQFQYIDPPKLEHVGGDIYKLSFQLPPTTPPQKVENGVPVVDAEGKPVLDYSQPIYPQSLYPIDVKFTTTTLRAYALTQTGSDYGLFGVSVESTANLLDGGNFEAGNSENPDKYPAYNDPISTIDDAEKTHWYFQQATKHWDFWYTYSIKNYPEGGNVNIYFEDVRDHIKYADGDGGIVDVGLFMNVAYFGKIYSVPVTQ